MAHKTRQPGSALADASPHSCRQILIVLDGHTSRSCLQKFTVILDNFSYTYHLHDVSQTLRPSWRADSVDLVLVAYGDLSQYWATLPTLLAVAPDAFYPVCLTLDLSGAQAPGLHAGLVDDALLEPLDARLATQQLKLWVQLSAERRRRVEAEQQHATALCKRIDMLTALFVQTPSAVVLLRAADGSVAYQNPQVQMILGQRFEADGRDWHGAPSFLQDQQQFDGLSKPSYFARAAAGEAFYNEAGHYRRADGGLIDIRLQASPVRDTRGCVVEVLFVFQESTPERRCAAQQAQLVRQLQVLADTSTSHVIMLDPSGRYIFANAMHRAFTQSSSAHLSGMRLAEVLGPEVYSRLRAGMKQAFEGQSSASEIELRVGEGCVGQFSVRWEPLRYLNYVDGRCEGTILYFRDLGALRQAQSDADLSAQRFKAICEELKIIVYTLDDHRGLRYLNGAWTDFTGRSAAESLGEAWLSSVHPDDVSMMRKLMAREDGQKALEYEFRLQNCSGTFEWHLGRSLPLDPCHQALGPQRVGMVVNIHERKLSSVQAEQRLRANMLARARAQQRWAQERVKVDALQREREAKENFVQALAHDLRTPLTVVRLGVQRLEYKLVQNTSLLPIIQRVQRSVIRIDNMIRDFLDVSRVNAGRSLSLERKPCCLIDVVRSTIEELAPLYNGQLEIGGTEPTFGMWDYDSMRRLIDNLVGNAIKYGDGARPITVGLCQEDQNAVLKVHNYGNAIPAEQRGALFERFTRLESPGNRGAEGWGIGLQLVAAIAAAYQGSVQLRSEPEEGTTFSVILPIVAPK